MKLFLLKPAVKAQKIWEPWYDKAFGFVVRATDEQQARLLAAGRAGDEEPDAWLDDTQSTCEELFPDGPAGVIIRDFAAA